MGCTMRPSGFAHGSLRLAVVAGLGLAFTAAMPSPAFADVVAENGGVRARADWDWGVQRLSNIDLGLRDLACDGNDVNMRLVITRQANPSITYSMIRTNSNGCGSARNWVDLSFSTSVRIEGVRVEACVNDFGSDTCVQSEYHDNPLVR